MCENKKLDDEILISPEDERAYGIPKYPPRRFTDFHDGFDCCIHKVRRFLLEKVTFYKKYKYEGLLSDVYAYSQHIKKIKREQPEMYKEWTKTLMIKDVWNDWLFDIVFNFKIEE